MKRDLDNLKKLIREHGFESIEDELLKHARPSIRVETKRVDDENELAIGQSKIGGRPDLPIHQHWARVYLNEHDSSHLNYGRGSLQFLAQFDLADIKPYDVENLLPESGTLYFFGDPFRASRYKHKGKVIFFMGDKSLLKRQSFPKDLLVDEASSLTSFTYIPCSVEFIPELNLDSHAIHEHIHNLPEGKTRIEFSRLVSATNYSHLNSVVPREVNRILGTDYDVAQDMPLECQLIKEYDHPYPRLPEDKYKIANKQKADWQLLFQLSSDENAGMMWLDLGIVCFYILKQDLKNQNFNNVCFSFFSS